ncbi:hypothetical protein Q428_07675 [Fervidicella metallireducens AeB]|uniref:SPOR domain-containing protein n=1 Tax=Fervidicella metallireducens AeB TaxID=1403537 RepID=A0A017RUK0_9CLOT|nr:SPOR domain-containing protein [Fervidicella metallireducens]EYE88453.1 hypothetical protein Q428_07675 [Fervidicella metallireducens AeB]
MRYTRLEIKGKPYDLWMKNIIYFFFIIPLVAMPTGKLVAKHVIIPNFIKMYTSQSDKGKDVISFKSSHDIYLVQAGVFLKKDNAESFQKFLKTKDINAIIFKDKEFYRVIAKISDSKMEIDKLNEKMQTLGYSCIITQFKFDNLVGYDEDEKVSNYMNIILQNILLQIDLINNENIDKNKYESQYKRNISILNSEVEYIKNSNKIDEKIKRLLQTLSKDLQVFIDNNSDKNIDIIIKEIYDLKNIEDYIRENSFK